MTKKQSSYPLALTLAILLHVMVFGFLFFHFVLPSSGTTSTPQVNIVQASIVNASSLAKPSPPPTPMAKVEQNQLHTSPIERPPEQNHHQDQAEKAQQAAEQQQAEQVQQKLKQEKLAQQQAEQQKQLAEQERIEQQQIAQQKQAAAKQKAIALAKQQKAAQQRLMMKQLQAEQQQLLQKQMKQEQQQLHASATSQQQQGVLDKYKAMIVQAISQNWLVPDNVDKSLSCQLLIQLGPGGVVLSVQIIRSSGNSVLDRSAQAAVYKTSPLPVPQNPALFDKFRSLRLTVRPESIISG
ncbi:MAG: cell envelope integrity protein TolA [Gammaproteobacteria bacterium]